LSESGKSFGERSVFHVGVGDSGTDRDDVITDVERLQFVDSRQ
jgi:hypothetical protein